MPAIIVLSACPAPYFMYLGGVAYFGAPAARWRSSPSEAYGMLTGYSLPAIPCSPSPASFSRRATGKRLVRLFKAFVRWMPAAW